MLWKKKLNDLKAKTPKKTEMLNGLRDKLNEQMIESSSDNKENIADLD